MLVSIPPSSTADPSGYPGLLSPAVPDREDNIVHKPINVAESNDKMAAHPRFWCGQHEGSGESTKDVYNYAIPVSDKSKTPMCQIAELARYHKLKHEYELMDESGPAHKKLFSVRLVLTPTQIFSGSGASIKKAQQSAAADALQNTTLTKPPEKNLKRLKRNGDASTPCVLLSHVCRRLKMVEPVYTMNSFYPPRGPPGAPPVALPLPLTASAPLPPIVAPGMMAHYPPLTPRSIVSPGCGPSSLVPQSSEAVPLGMCYLLPGGGLKPNRNTLPTLEAPTHMCTIVMASHPPVHAIAENKQEARHQAATQALCLLGPALAMLEQRMKEEKEAEKSRKESETNKENVRAVEGATSESGAATASTATRHSSSPESPGEEAEEEQQRREKAGEGSRGGRKKAKSVVSQVHECALQMKLTVEFEVLAEEGRAHDRSYTVECRLLGGETVLQARGSGRQKREAKQAACAELIETLRKMESSPIHIATVLYKAQRRPPLSAPPSRESKRKTIVKHMKMDPSYGHQINPVSRLIQVLQVRGEPEPVFEFLGEAGQYKYKQFNVQVVVGDLFAEGSGPNKRLAKRAAAELMLELIGVAKRLPEPGKSLLKKREDENGNGGAMMSIGVFNPDDLMDPQPPAEPAPAVPAAVVDAADGKGKKKKGVAWGGEEEAVEGEEKEEGEKKEEPRRRVTFNAHVAACIAPDDVSYPTTEVAPLKADDLGCAGKARRRGREGKTRTLTESQRAQLGELVLAWIERREEKEEDIVFRIESVTAPPDARTPAKQKLDKLGTQFGFNSAYTIFPQGECGSNSSTSSSAVSSGSSACSTPSGDPSSPLTPSAAFFVIVNIPFTQAIMGEGHGDTMEEAHEAAAADALAKIAADSKYVPRAVAAAAIAAATAAQQQPKQLSPQQKMQQQHQQQPPMRLPVQQPAMLQQQQQAMRQMQQQPQQMQQPNPYYNGGYSGMTSPHPMPIQQQEGGGGGGYYNGGGGGYQSASSPYELPSMAEFYGQYDSSAYGMATGAGSAPPLRPSPIPPLQRPPSATTASSSHNYPSYGM